MVRVAILAILSLQAFSEGTPSFWKNYTGLGLSDESGGYVCNFMSNPVNGNYPGSTFNSDSLNRVYVHVDDPTTEIINFGFNVRRVWFRSCNQVGTDQGNYTSTVTGGRRVFWRLKDPNGTVVASSGGGGIPYWNGGLTTSSTPGYIGTYNEAANGPDGVDGTITAGYTPNTVIPTMAGD